MRIVNDHSKNAGQPSVDGDLYSLASMQKEIAARSYPRELLVSALRQYNASIGNDNVALQNINRLLSNEQGCVVTGQQLGFMGGPAYTILKGISCLITARENGAVPIFWLATEDHDVAEIDHAYLLDTYGNLKYFHLSLPKDGRCVEDLVLNDKHIEIINQFFKSASLDQKEWPGINASYAQTMAQFMVKIFEGTGMVFLEPKILRPLAGAFFRREIEDCDLIHNTLQETTIGLQAQGLNTPISFNGGTNLFLKDEHGLRKKIKVHGNDYHWKNSTISKQELLQLVDDYPERFSTNVAARPILQSLLIPTLAYIAGPSEIEYFRQLPDYYRMYGLEMPRIIPRISATFIPQHAADILTHANIDLNKSLPVHWLDIYPELVEELTQLSSGWMQSALKNFHNDVSEEVVARSIRKSIHILQKKILRSRLRKHGLPIHGLHLLNNLIHPHHKPQERVLNWLGFQGVSCENLVKEMLKLSSKMSQGHLYCYC